MLRRLFWFGMLLGLSELIYLVSLRASMIVAIVGSVILYGYFTHEAG